VRRLAGSGAACPESGVSAEESESVVMVLIVNQPIGL